MAGGSRAVLQLPACEVWLLLLIALLAASCAGDSGAGDTQTGRASSSSATSVKLRRTGRFGTLRDFVLFERPQDAPGLGLFVDRFEATQSDWDEFAATASGQSVSAQEVSLIDGPGRASLPACNMDLAQARAFARWRMGRLPSEEEWRRVTVSGGNSPFPWGGNRDASRANTGDLGLLQAMPVGTFESGRKSGGYAPYDLIGNVREWTETVPHAWCKRGLLQVDGMFLRSWQRALSAPALSVWSSTGGVLPLGAIAGTGGGGVPRMAVGSDFETPMSETSKPEANSQLAGDRRQRTGLRVYSTVDELLARLIGLPGSFAKAEWLQVKRFVAREDHRRILHAALEASPLGNVELPAGSIARQLCDEIRRDPETRR